MQRIGDGVRTTYVLSTGRHIRAVLGVIGLCDGEPVHGFDGHIDLVDPPEGGPWTPEERAELADFMIEQWRQFKANAPAGESATPLSQR